MAGVADKARFYLERAAPQLREFEEKQIFTKDEIRTLVQKRSEHEHLILSPGSKPADFLTYAQWEQSLDALRAKRCRRLRITNASAKTAKSGLSAAALAKVASPHASQARTFGIFERAVQKHPGCVPLWRAYLDAASVAGAQRRWRKVATRAVRMHPREEALWVLVGRRAADQGDMAGARALFMRGCRFCDGPEVWMEYARVEMEWLEKVARRRKGGPGGGGGGAATQTETIEGGDTEGEIRFDEDDDEDKEGVLGEDGELGGGAALPKRAVFDADAAQKLRNPALDGAIPIAIFDVAMKQRFAGSETAETFFDLFSTFTNVPSQPKVLQHVLDRMADLYPDSPSTYSCHIRQPLIAVDTHTAAFAQAIRESLSRLKTYLDKTKNRELLVSKTVAWMDSILATGDLDEGIRTVLEHTKRKLQAS